MDEPTSVLDPISTEKIESLRLELKKDYTIIIVTHNMQQAHRTAYYMTYFHLGKEIEYNQTRELFNNPQEQLTRDYIEGA